MKTYTRLILLTFLLLCLYACGNNPYPQSLLAADSLANVQPDSAATEASPEVAGYKVKKQINNPMGTLFLYQKTDESPEMSNDAQTEEKEHKQSLIIIISLICLLGLAPLFAYLQYTKRKNLQIKIQSDKAEALKNEQHRKSVEIVEEKKQVETELAKREQADNSIKETEIYKHIQKQLTTTGGRKLLSGSDWKELEEVINRTYSGFTEYLYSLYNLNEHEYRVCLLIKIKTAPIDIARLTVHSKEAISSTRRRLYRKVFHKNGSPKDWDDFIVSL